jgi:ubiquinone/menaquinone biosynthesis C-methylase UbiE
MNFDKEVETEDWYKKYYLNKGFFRNSIFNKQVTLQHLAYEKCWIEMFRDVPLKSKILDVGGGSGAGLLKCLQAGFDPKNLFLIDIIEKRILEAKNRLPETAHVIHGDATDLNLIENSSFDVVTSSTMFIQLTDEVNAQKIGSEMMRVLKNDGCLLIFDWKYDFWREGYLAVNKSRLKTIFGNNIKIEKSCKGQLLPPLGRFLSEFAPSLYFLIQKLPFVTGLFCYKIVKNIN